MTVTSDLSPQKTFTIVTYGCKVNQYDSQAVREQLERTGLTEVQEDACADVYVVNSCSVTAAADHDALERIRDLRRRAPEATIIATGCFAEVGEHRLRNAGATTVLPNRLKHRVADLLDPAPDLIDTAAAYTPLTISRFAQHTRAFLKIQDGCRFRCAYCRVPFVRGAGVSRRHHEITDEAQRLLDAGHRELVLTGVCLGSYGQDRREPDALARVMASLSTLPDTMRLRLSSIEPWGITPRLLAVIRDDPRWCRYLHIPFQSGSDATLTRMRRPGSMAWYQRLMDHIHHALPDVSVGADLIVGFPGETAADFAATLQLLRAFRLTRVHWFPFSPREGTAGAALSGRMPPSIIQQRMAQARTLYDAQRHQRARRLLGSRATILRETHGGYTASYDRVRLRDHQVRRGAFVTTTLKAWDGEAFIGSATTPL